MYPVVPRAAIAAVLYCTAVPAFAADPVATPQPEMDAGSRLAATITIPALTPVELRVVDEVSSKTAISGSPVKLVLERTLHVAPDLAIPAGTEVEGVVIHAAKGGMGGKAGELIIGAKRIRLADGVDIPLRSFRLGAARGKNNEGLAMAATVAGGVVGAVAGLLITGGSAKAPAGALAFAKTAAAVEVPTALLTRLQSAVPVTVSVSEPEILPTPTTKGE